MTTDNLKILLVDDHKIVTESLSVLLQTIMNCTIVGEIHSGEDSINFLATNKADIIFMDIVMPGRINGIAATHLIKSKYPKTKVIALTMLYDSSTIREMLKIGVDGFLIKNTSSEQLLKAIDFVLSDQIYIHPQIINKLNLLGDIKNTALINLTEIEYNVLKLIIEGMTTKAIAAHLFRSPETIKTHRKRIMSKLNCSNLVDLVKFTIHNNLMSNK